MKSTPNVAKNAPKGQSVTVETPVVAHPSTPPAEETTTAQASPPAPEPAPVVKALTRLQILAERESKCRKLMQLTRSLDSLRASSENLNNFKVDTAQEVHGRTYAGIKITDDQNKSFETKNPVLITLLVAHLDGVLQSKISELESELIAIA